MKNKYKYIVIGAGSGGLTVAIGLAKTGKEVLLVSKNIGGDCTNFGCVPSKSLIHYADEFVKGKIKKENVLKKVREDITKTIEHDASLMKIDNITFVESEAKVSGKNTVQINGNDIEFKKLIISSGSSPRRISIPSLPKNKLITNEEIFDLKEIPESLTILGGGPIGIELGTAFAKLGTKVNIIARSGILSKEPQKYTKIIKENLRKLQVNIIENAKNITYDNKDKKIICEVKTGNKINEIELKGSNYYLSAIGRIPNTSLNLEAGGIEFDKKGIIINEEFKTSNKNTYAIGDCINGQKFTHLANNHGRFLVKKFLLPWTSRMKPIIPRTTFSDPPISSVGEIIKSDLVQEFNIDFNKSDRGKIDNIKNEFGKVYVHMITGEILGASLIGKTSEHLINFFTLAIQEKVSMFKLDQFMTPYPTYFNSFNSLYTQFLNKFISDLKQNIFILLRLNLTRIAAVIFWLVFGIFTFIELQKYNFNILSLLANLQEIFNSPLGAIAFIALYSLRGLIMFPGTILTASAGLFFGITNGIILTIIGSNLSSTINFALGKFILGRNKNSNQSTGIRKHIQNNTFFTVLISRLAGFPYDLLSYISGALNVSYPYFILATILGAIPGTIAIVSIGASVNSIEDLRNLEFNTNYAIFGIVLLITSMIVGVVMKKISNSRK